MFVEAGWGGGRTRHNGLSLGVPGGGGHRCQLGPGVHLRLELPQVDTICDGQHGGIRDGGRNDRNRSVIDDGEQAVDFGPRQRKIPVGCVILDNLFQGGVGGVYGGAQAAVIADKFGDDVAVFRVHVVGVFPADRHGHCLVLAIDHQPGKIVAGDLYPVLDHYAFENGLHLKRVAGIYLNFRARFENIFIAQGEFLIGHVSVQKNYSGRWDPVNRFFHRH